MREHRDRDRRDCPLSGGDVDQFGSRLRGAPFIIDTVACLRPQRVTAQRNGVAGRCDGATIRPENSAVPARPPAAAPPAGGSAPKRPFLSATFELVPSWKTRFSSQPLDLAAKFSLASEFKANVALFGFEDDLRFALAHDSPGGWSQSGRV